jgi:sugar O-acyltransferase (sialic acid O-acetyltransferase NeuD family)
MKDILIFGNGSTAQMLAYHMRKEGFNIAAFTVDKEYIKDKQIEGIDVFPFEGIEERFLPAEYTMFIAIGPVKLNQLRADRCSDAERLGYSIHSYISKTAIVWDGFEIKPNCKIGERTICQPYSQIGKNVFVGSGCIIGHGTLIGDNCFLGSGVIIGGNVSIGANSFLGTGCIIRNDIKIAEKCVIGAGVTLLESTTPSSVYINTSAQKMPVSSEQVQYG